jgi:hypothetical protein
LVIAALQGLVDLLQIVIAGTNHFTEKTAFTLPKALAIVVTLCLVIIVINYIYKVRDPQHERRMGFERRLFGVELDDDFPYPYMHSVNEVLGAVCSEYAKDIADAIVANLLKDV